MGHVRRFLHGPKRSAAIGVLVSGVLVVAATAWACTAVNGSTTTSNTNAFTTNSSSKTLDMGTGGSNLPADTYRAQIREPDRFTNCAHSPSGTGSSQYVTLSSPGTISSRSVTLTYDQNLTLNGGPAEICWSNTQLSHSTDHASTDKGVTFS